MNLVEGEFITDIEEIDEGWWTGVGPGGKTGLFPANYVEVVPQTEAHEEEAAAPLPPPPPSFLPPPPAVVPVVPVVPAAPRPPTPPPAPDVGISAIALYDYEAAEDNEISFNEGDKITDIEPASEDWWQGMNPHGSVGLFPANYVEMLAQE